MGKTPSPAYEFIVAHLRDDPNLTFHAVRDLGEAVGLRILPVVYGRAKALLGLVPVTSYGQKKFERKKRSKVTPESAGGSGERRPAPGAGGLCPEPG